MIKRIDHIAIAVNSIEQTLKFYSAALGLELSHTDVEEGQRVVVAFLPAGEGEVELVEPVGDDSPISRFLQKRGEGLHHICFEVADIEGALARLKGHGVELINEEPYIGTGGKKIAFVHPRSAHGVLIELYQKRPDEVRPGLIDLRLLRERLLERSRTARAGARAFLSALQNKRTGIE